MIDLLQSLAPPRSKRSRDEASAVDGRGTPPAVDYPSWSKSELVSEARRRHLATSGNKQDLIDRLSENDDMEIDL